MERVNLQQHILPLKTLSTFRTNFQSESTGHNSYTADISSHYPSDSIELTISAQEVGEEASASPP